MSYWNADHIFPLALKNSGLMVKEVNGRDTTRIHCLRKFFFTQMLQPLEGTSPRLSWATNSS